ncbi:MAG TPA: protein-methionine-sulfoxide reductase catalytic subunit MsrP [Anaerolineaceae bacterium]
MSAKKTFSEPPSSEITPEALYFNRRAFLKAAGLLGFGGLLAACGVPPAATTNATGNTSSTPAAGSTAASSAGLKDELGDPANSFADITNYNNYYEFSEGKEDVAPLSAKFPSSPWQVEVSGMVQNPMTLSMEDILKKYPQEERIYRLRCVEAWSMVIPWTGFPLAKLLKDVQPTGSAKYVKFTTAELPNSMPGLSAPYPWPYTEGLRLDEAMNDLAFLVTGLYGKPLPNQDGAPIRLTAPWKYGFKGAKALVKIELVSDQPQTFWNTLASNEYGFYSNVNPDVNHPRWSQATERRIGESARRKTLLFNGYGAQVAQLYTGMDLRANY